VVPQCQPASDVVGDMIKKDPPWRDTTAAARDPVCADTFAAFGSRCIGVTRFLRPDPWRARRG
jgi:hypothetical protein